MEVAIMIEGQNGLNWPRWKRLVKAVEDLGFAGLYRSDHYTNSRPPDKDSLELWVSLTWLAANTNRIHFGPLVTPLSFRDPVITARMAVAVDDLSGGRLTLGVGAGWQEREHTNYGWQLLDVPGRLNRLEEGLQIISHLFNDERPLDFNGKYYKLHDAVLLPRPARLAGPPLLVGGKGKRRTLPIVARYADEWNGSFLSPERYAELNMHLDSLVVQAGRQPEDIKRSIMVGTIFARHETELTRKLANENSWWYGYPREELRQSGIICGLADEFREQLYAYKAAGVQRIMLQWLDLDDLDGLESLALELV